jgi:hypothetical protein
MSGMKEKYQREERIYKALIFGVALFAVAFLSFLAYLLVAIPDYLRNVTPATEVQLPETGVGDYRVFVTSQTFTGNLGGVSGADNICQSLADNAKLGGRWGVWLSTSSINAKERIVDEAYFLVNSTSRVSEDKSDLTDGSLISAISLSETQASIDGLVWTGTLENGTGSGINCSNWTSSSSAISGQVGNSNESNSSWTSSEVNTANSCNNSYHLYCFEYLKDRDGDGHFEDLDCNDSNADIHPGSGEICNNVDENCNGKIDENLTQECGKGIGECKRGIRTCDSGVWGVCIGEIGPTSERCDNKDNDCDGAVDESLTRECGTNVGICSKGVERCAGGKWGNCSGVQPQSEACDGLDNDCDGQVDEGCSCDSGTTQQCGTDIGACSVGTQWCTDGSWGTCFGASGPGVEICDASDNDCNGKTDENLIKSCGSDVGSCKAGVQYCNQGEWGECSGQVDPVDEICDTLDNDCDGTIDEGCGCMQGEERICGQTEGECSSGLQKCLDGSWGECEGSKEAKDEICDGLDNDCDGETDEGYVCEEISALERLQAETKIEEEEKAGDFLGSFKEMDFVKVLILALITSITLIIGLVAWNKFKTLKTRRAVKRFKEGTKKISRKKEALSRSPLG